jgi:hypothetical protein
MLFACFWLLIPTLWLLLAMTLINWWFPHTDLSFDSASFQKAFGFIPSESLGGEKFAPLIPTRAELIVFPISAALVAFTGGILNGLRRIEQFLNKREEAMMKSLLTLWGLFVAFVYLSAVLAISRDDAPVVVAILLGVLVVIAIFVSAFFPVVFFIAAPMMGSFILGQRLSQRVFGK